MKKLNKKFDNENGSALVIVMMVLVVVSALGGALGMVTINSHRLANHTQDSNSAYYIAEAGANMAYEEFKTEVLSAYGVSSTENDFFEADSGVKKAQASVNGKVYSEGVFQKTGGIQPTASIEVGNPVGNDDQRTFTIKSTGNIDGKTRTVEKIVKVNWVDKKSGGSNPPDSFPIDLSNALTYNSNVFIGKDGTIIGTILYPDVMPYIRELPNIENLTHEGDKKTFNREEYRWGDQKEMIYDWILPIVNQRISGLDFSKAKINDVVYANIIGGHADIDGDVIAKDGNIHIKKGANVTGDVIATGDIIIEGGAYIDGHVIATNGNIIIEGNANIVGHVIAKVGEIHFKQDANVTGDVIATNKDIKIEGDADIGGDVIATNGEIRFDKEAEVGGSVIKLGDDKSLKFGQKKTIVKGNVISNRGEIRAGKKVIIEGATINPSGKIVAEGNESKFLGPVIADDITIAQDSLIDYSDNYLKFFPFNNTQGAGDGNAGGGNIEDIISTKPATEN